MQTIALDAMGGDHGPPVIVPAALKILAEQQDLALILVGDQQVLTRELNRQRTDAGDRLSIQHASQHVTMDELPSQALRNKKDSSMRIAINLVKEGTAAACVSAGNTGALMATARYVLKTLPGVDRPAIITTLPTMNGHTHMLDLGANVDSCSEHLFQFAIMGSVLTSAVDNIERPTVGLLNIGEEEIKGNDVVKEAARLLANSGINYVGFVEGNDIYSGVVDVIVCDGFVGNVALKSSEGVARMLAFYMKQEFSRNLFTRNVASISGPIIKSFYKKIDPGCYNGASLVGLQGIVIKSHGSADVLSYANAIKVAVVEARESVPERISSQLQTFHENRQAS